MSEEQNNPTMTESTSTTNSDKNWIGVVAYITIIGWIVAIIMNNNPENKTEFGSFHIRQFLGIFLSMIAISFINIIPLLGQIVYLLGALFMFVIWIIGFVGAVQGQMKVVPVVGEYYQKWFASL